MIFIAVPDLNFVTVHLFFLLYHGTNWIVIPPCCPGVLQDNDYADMNEKIFTAFDVSQAASIPTLS